MFNKMLTAAAYVVDVLCGVNPIPNPNSDPDVKLLTLT